MKSDVIETIKSLSHRTSLLPSEVARDLHRRLELRDENDYRCQYALIGGVGRPFQKAELRWGKRKPGGQLYVETASGVQIPIREVISELTDFGNFTPILPDPRDPAPRMCLAYRVPAGELRLIFPGSDQQDFLEAFVVSQFPVVAWPSQAVA